MTSHAEPAPITFRLNRANEIDDAAGTKIKRYLVDWHASILVPSAPVMPTKRLEERFQFSGGKVRRPGVDGFTGTYPIIEDVLLCGPTSANNRDYPVRAFAGNRIKRYESKAVFLNHGDPRASRDLRDKVGWIENVRHNPAGLPIGNIGLNPKHAESESILWAAENRKDFAGLSHVAECKFSSKDGRDVVEEVIEVLSVDLVVDPATTKGFFENRNSRRTMKLSQFSEWVAKHPKSTTTQCLRVKAVAEMEGYGDKEVSEPAEGGEPEGAIDSAFKDLLHAHVEELVDESQTVEEFCKKVQALWKAQKGKPKEGGEGEGEPKKKDDEPPKESRGIGFDKALSLIAEAKYTATPAEIKVLAKVDSEAEAKAFIAEQSGKSSATPPRSSGRTAANPPKASVAEQKGRIPAWNAVA